MSNVKELSIMDVDIISFRRILLDVEVFNQVDAVELRHKIQDIENILPEWKEAADTHLYNRCNQVKKAIIEDEVGNQFAVIQVEQNEIKYEQTPELLSAIAALEEAKDYMKKVQSVTPSWKEAKGKGYYYKVSKP